MSVLQFDLGLSRVSILNAGDFNAPLRNWFSLPNEMLPRLPAFEMLPVQCAAIAIGEARVLVDAPRWEFGAESAPADYAPPASIPEQLRAIGMPPESMTHIVITHAHEDHLNALLDGETPVFPNAFHYIGRADYDWALARPAREGEGAATARILETLNRQNLLMRIGRDVTIAPGVFALHTPGETPGHLVVRINSAGQTLYCLGDLWHHPVELAQNLAVYWADGESKRQSRTGLAIAALADDAMLMATHIRGIGKLVHSDDRLIWAHGELPGYG